MIQLVTKDGMRVEPDAETEGTNPRPARATARKVDPAANPETLLLSHIAASIVDGMRQAGVADTDDCEVILANVANEFEALASESNERSRTLLETAARDIWKRVLDMRMG